MNNTIALILVAWYWRRLVFSERTIFMRELQPQTLSDIIPGGYTSRVAWPDALFMITIKDVRRARAALKRIRNIDND